ncbi:MAG: hypothetical protein RL459_1305 [Pseudomonadota bacterium]
MLRPRASRHKQKWPYRGRFYLERVMGIEPTLFAWEARVLPLNDTREMRLSLLQNLAGSDAVAARVFGSVEGLVDSFE